MPVPTATKAQASAADFVGRAKELRGVIVQIVAPTTGKIGSGFWVTDKGYVATCWHVVQDSPNAKFVVRTAVDPLFDLKKSNVVNANWQTFSADLVAQDEENDLAVLKVASNPFRQPPPVVIKLNDVHLSAHFERAALTERLPEAGEKVFLAGYPLGQPYPVVQQGSVASVAYDLPTFGSRVKILLSIVANHGNSGGPVIDDKGKVVGILEAGLPSTLPNIMDPAVAQSGIAVVVPSYFLVRLLNSKGIF